jgi:hypothetical protein
MKIEKFNEVKELMNEIDSIKSDMDRISYLLKSCSLSCIISSGRGRFSVNTISLTDNTTIRKLLSSELNKLKKKLVILEGRFNSL